MNVKKINAVLALLTLAALIGHAGTMGVSLWTGWYDYALCKALARGTVTLMTAHALLSIAVFFFCHDGAQTQYGGANRGTIIQRGSAIALLVLIHIHTRAYAHMATGVPLSVGQTVFFSAAELLYFAAIWSHVAVSVSRAAVTLGIARSARAVGRIDRAAWVVCGISMLLLSGGMLAFFWGGAIG